MIRISIFPLYVYLYTNATYSLFKYNLATSRIMLKLKFQLDRKSLETILISFIRPLLEYANVIWDNSTKYESEQLERIQNEAARFVTEATKLVSLHSLYIDTGWESLAARREKTKTYSILQMQNGLTQEYLSSLVPPTVGSTVRFALRNESHLQTVPAKSHKYFNSFLPSATRS